jgi:hypothetical protein
MNKQAKQAVMEFNALVNTPVKIPVETEKDILKLIYYKYLQLVGLKQDYL